MLKPHRRFRSSTIVIALFLCLIGYETAHGQTSPRFRYSGDGVLVLNGETIVFRSGDVYQESGLKRIHQIFGAGASWPNLRERLNLRFIEIMDYVQDQLQGGTYTLKSGYRSPTYNQSLRNRGKLAAQSSMHTEGAAADLSLSGVPSSKVFEFVKFLDCCGIGWYHSKHFHIDSGPSRYWDETSSKTEDKTPQQNEKIILQPDYDRYRPGETVELKFMRVTEYPIGVPLQFELIPQEIEGRKTQNLPVEFDVGMNIAGTCMTIENRHQGRGLKVKLPAKGLKPGLYSLRVQFCNRYQYEKMPAEILSKSFEVIL